MPGIGRVQQAHLAALDIHKVSDLISQRGTLAHLFTAGTVQFYLATALGLGSNQVFILHFVGLREYEFESSRSCYY